MELSQLVREALARWIGSAAPVSEQHTADAGCDGERLGWGAEETRGKRKVGAEETGEKESGGKL